MSPSPANTPLRHGPRLSRARRPRQGRFSQGLRAVITVAAAWLAIAAAQVIAARLAWRLDTTAERAHGLAPRSAAVLAALDAPHTLLAVASAEQLGPAGLRDLTDALTALDNASPDLTIAFIDTDQPAGRARFEDQRRELVAREASVVMDQVGVLRAAGQTLAAAAASVRATAETLAAARREPPPAGPADVVGLRVAQIRVAADDLEQAQQAVEADLSVQTAWASLPDTPAAARALTRRASRIGESIADAADWLGSSDPAASVLPLDARRAAQRALQAARTAVADAAERARALPTPDLFRVGDALASGEALVLIRTGEPGTPSLAAIPLDAIAPTTALPDGRRARLTADLRARAEALVITAVQSLADDERPLAVIVHAEAGDGSPESSDRIAQGLDRALAPVRRQLALSGIDLQLALLTDAEPVERTLLPARLAPAGTGTAATSAATRPIIYCLFGTDTDSAAGVRRAELLARAASHLLATGRPMLVSPTPSAPAAFGAADPLTAALAPLPVHPLTAAPLLRREPAAEGRFLPRADLRPVLTDRHPAVAGLAGRAVRFRWALPLELTGDQPSPDTPGAAPMSTAPTSTAPISTALVTLPGSDDLWAEAEWLTLWRTERSASPDQASRFNAGIDRRDDGYTLAAAIDRRTASPADGGARVALVGARWWVLDADANPTTSPNASSAGADTQATANAELFESLVLWLAGRDEPLAASALTAARPVITATEADLARSRWTLILSLPLGVLALGLLARILRG